ncbi:pectate lyase family protein [Sandarakinorhabdus sp. DWP1-3-1]|uniref:pectate lyase family protein n=1 Tax=Sandarakinorhabdus sp. DWP1-3-1 TaxID=2804627 RepID=UPI003CF0D4C0
MPLKTGAWLACVGLAAGLAAGLAGPAAAALPAFPGAAGFGRDTPGGRGGAIIPVTTLADSGPGSLRACIDARGPRVCVFRVGGVIRFTTTRPMIVNPGITIAGQTAPGGGILLTHDGGPRGYTPLVIKNTHDVIVRHIRVRPDKRGDDRGANGAFTIENSRNVILDHVSGSWALDQNLSGYGTNDRVTVSWSIFAEGIQPHDKCALMASDPKGPQSFSFIANLCAHNGDRNPDANFPKGSCVEINNNVLYNAASQFVEIWESYGGTPVNVIGNVIRTGPNTPRHSYAIDRPRIGSTGRARIYHADNIIDGNIRGMVSPDAAGAIVAAPVCGLKPPPLTAARAYGAVLATAGAFPRDSFDRRIVAEVRSRTGQIPRTAGQLPVIANAAPYPDADRDGMDDRWERARGLDTATNDAWSDKDGDGWPNFDNFLDTLHRRAISNGK